MAHHGAAAYQDRYELVRRREATRPNEQWQADHTELDLLVLDAAGRPARPCLTVVLDDHSRVVAGYTVSSARRPRCRPPLALRQAMWHKTDPAWPVCGLPDLLYSDHRQGLHRQPPGAGLRRHPHPAVALHPGVPQGRGKIERFFGTVTTELLPTLPGTSRTAPPASR